MSQPAAVSDEPERSISAASGNRAAALLLDLMLLAFTGGALAEFEGIAAVLPFAFLLYFVGMPLTAIQGTLGKWVCRIKLCDRQGRRLTWRASALRTGATVLWFALPALLHRLSVAAGMEGVALQSAAWLLFFLPWAPIGWRPQRESLFDLLAKTRVVRASIDAADVIRSASDARPSRWAAAGIVVLCIAAGATFAFIIQTQHTMSMHARIRYAVEQTEPLRDKVAAFHGREGRWPAPQELGASASTPYPDGGGYRLHGDGRVEISFTVLPELKGRGIVLRPWQAGDGKPIQWRCEADPRIDRRYVRTSCR